MVNYDNFGLGDVEADKGTVGVTSGQHDLRIISAKFQDTKSGTGKYVNVHFGVKGEGTFFSKYNIVNESEEAQKIGRGQFKSMLLALGMDKAQVDTFGVGRLTELEGCELNATLKVSEDPTYGQQVKITVYKAKNFNQPTKPTTTATTSKSPF